MGFAGVAVCVLPPKTTERSAVVMSSVQLLSEQSKTSCRELPVGGGEGREVLRCGVGVSPYCESCAFQWCGRTCVDLHGLRAVREGDDGSVQGHENPMAGQGLHERDAVKVIALVGPVLYVVAGEHCQGVVAL